MQAIRPEQLRTGDTFKMSPKGRTYTATDVRVYDDMDDEREPGWVTVWVEAPHSVSTPAVTFDRIPEARAFVVERARVAEAA